MDAGKMAERRLLALKQMIVALELLSGKPGWVDAQVGAGRSDALAELRRMECVAELACGLAEKKRAK